MNTSLFPAFRRFSRHVPGGIDSVGVMPRQPRIEDEAALYHVMAHGDERKAIMALAIKTRTTVALDWVVKRLHMVTRSTVRRTAPLVKSKLERDGKLSRALKKIGRALKS